jgi:hypothetical protein
MCLETKTAFQRRIGPRVPTSFKHLSAFSLTQNPKCDDSCLSQVIHVSVLETLGIQIGLADYFGSRFRRS